MNAYAPLLSYADFSALLNMPSAQLAPATQYNQCDQQQCSSVLELTNVGTTVAFFVRYRLVAVRDGTDVLPATYTSNFDTLFPKVACSACWIVDRNVCWSPLTRVH